MGDDLPILMRQVNNIQRYTVAKEITMDHEFVSFKHNRRVEAYSDTHYWAELRVAEMVNVQAAALWAIMIAADRLNEV